MIERMKRMADASLDAGIITPEEYVQYLNDIDPCFKAARLIIDYFEGL